LGFVLSQSRSGLARLGRAPLILASYELKPLRAFLLGFLSGLASTFGIFYWVFEVPGFGIHIRANVANLFTEGIAIAEVTAGQSSTSYTRFGDFFAFACMIIVLVSITISIVRKK
jgi:apolipoprotein N-acyltransferase